MTIPTTRAEARALVVRVEARPWQSTTFWVDLGERVVWSAAGGALAVYVSGGFDITSADSWGLFGIGALTAAGLSFLKGIIAGTAGNGSASSAPGV